MIFVHGNMGSNYFFKDIPNLATDFTVYIPDTRSHGKSDKVKRLNYNDIADDIANLIKHEQIEKPIFFGFSDGGIVGLLLALKYPNVLDKLFVAGINLTPKGIKPFWRFVTRAVFCLTFPFRFSDKMRLMLTQPNITADQLKTIAIPTTVFYGEKDIVHLSHSQTIIDNIQGSKLIIVPNADHGNYIADNKRIFELIIKEL